MSKPISRRSQLEVTPSNRPTGIRVGGEASTRGEFCTPQSTLSPIAKPHNAPPISLDTVILANADPLLSLGRRPAPEQRANVPRMKTRGLSKIPCLRAVLVNSSAPLPSARLSRSSTARSLIPRLVALRTPAQYKSDKVVLNLNSRIPRLRPQPQGQAPNLPPPAIFVVDEHGSNVLDTEDHKSTASESSESSESLSKSRVNLSTPNATLQPPSPYDISSAQDEAFSDLLQNLMELHKPQKLNGEVSIPQYQDAVHGGFAVVYTGEWRGIQVGVKVLKYKKPRLKHGPYKLMRKKLHETIERRINREMIVWAALKHPNICEFLGYVTEIHSDAYPAMVSMWCENGTAVDYTENNDLSRGERLRLTLDMGEGLKYLHQLDIAHGDLKPANIFVDHNGVAKLSDFGLVRLIDWRGWKGMTTTSPYGGTPLYRAPELVVSEKNPDPRATIAGDMYSAGSIMLEFIEQVPPFHRFHPSHQDIMSAIMDNLQPALRTESSATLEHMTERFWNLLEACWGNTASRPTATKIVEALFIIERELSIST